MLHFVNDCDRALNLFLFREKCEISKKKKLVSKASYSKKKNKESKMPFLVRGVGKGSHSKQSKHVFRANP